MIQRGQIPADVVFSMASPMDEKGFFSLSLGPDYTMAAVAKARAVLLEVNPNVPFTHGNCHVHISQVSALVESDDPVMGKYAIAFIARDGGAHCRSILLTG